MTIPEDVKKIAVILGVSGLLFWIIKPKQSKGSGLLDFFQNNKRTPIRKPLLDEESLQDPDVKKAYDALCAYIDASNAGEKDSVLEEIKKEYKAQMNIEIYTDSAGKLAVRDLSGEDILVNS